MPKFLTAAFLLAFVLSGGQPAAAKARLVVVFPIRSTPDLASRAKAATQEIVARLSSMQGFDAKALPAPVAGGMGISAAAAGAEFYVSGQLIATDSGAQILLGAFQTATDKQVGNYQAVETTAAAFPEQPPIASLIPVDSTAVSAAAPSDKALGAEVAGGLPIDVHVDSPITSNGAKIGDIFAFQAMNDIVSDGWIIVQKGAQGQGEVVQAEAAGGNGHPGKLGIQFDWITAVDGTKIKMSTTPNASEGEGKTGAASTATIASYLVLGPLGLFAHNFVKGKDLTIQPTTKLTGYVEHTVHVAATQREEPAPGFAPK